jgi:peroxiredoxin
MNALSSRRKWLAVAAGALMAGAALAYMLLSRPAAPDVRYVTLNGEVTSTQGLQGKVVFVNFWATSCTTCIKEMPELIKTYERYAPSGFEVLAVAMSYDPPQYVETYTRKNKLPFKVVLDKDGSIAQAFGGVKLTPTAVLIDKRGKVLKRILGEPDWAALHGLIEHELAA